MCKFKTFEDIPQDFVEAYFKPNKVTKLTKSSFLNFINMLNENGHTLLSEYHKNQECVLIDFHCGHEASWIRPNNYKDGNRCYKCGCKKRNEQRFLNSKTEFELLVKENGHTLLTEYIGDKEKVLIDFNCGHEPHLIQPNVYKNGSGCPKCGHIKQVESWKINFYSKTEEERKEIIQKMKQTKANMTQEEKDEIIRKMRETKLNKTGGITNIYKHFRTKPYVKNWTNLVLQEKDYTCELSGIRGGKLAVHHLYSFSEIIVDAHIINNIEIKSQLGQYTFEELRLLEEYIVEWHKDTSNAVVLSEEVHKLFHINFMGGYTKHTTEQDYIEFKERYLNGEFNTEEIDSVTDVA